MNQSRAFLQFDSPGLVTTVQDLGRPHHQSSGVPVSGAIDTESFRIANLLVGNKMDAAAVEVTMIGPRCTVLADALVGYAGANLGLLVNGTRVEPFSSVGLKRGDQILWGQRVSGARSYLAVAGGLDVPEVLGSRSTCLRGGFGGHCGRALRATDILHCFGAATAADFITRSIPEERERTRRDSAVRVVLNRDVVAELSGGWKSVESVQFKLSHRSDRMGCRLEGPKLLRHSDPSASPISAAMPVGAVQLPPDGVPIILMADRQTIGGYPLLGVVASVDLPAVAQLAPGDPIRLTAISLELAEELYCEREKQLRFSAQVLIY